MQQLLDKINHALNNAKPEVLSNEFLTGYSKALQNIKADIELVMLDIEKDYLNQ